MQKSLVVACYAYDGGSGKTTTTLQVAKQLVAMGYTVLCLDMDPKGSLTARIGLTPEQTQSIKAGMNTSNLLLCVSPIEATAIQIKENLFVVGTVVPDENDTGISLQAAAARIQTKSPNHNWLRRAIDRSLITLFDVILVDCPATSDILTANIVYACDYVITPVQLDRESVTDVGNVAKMVAEMGELSDRKPALGGVVLTKTEPRTKLYREVRLEVLGLGVKMLAEIPYRVGVDSEKIIFNSYLTAAGHVALWLEAAKNA